MGEAVHANSAIVIGFVGGFVSRDDTHHPELQLIRALQHEYSKDVYFELLENRKVDEAYATILTRVGKTNSDSQQKEEGKQTRILLFGHSWGASAAIELSRRLDRVRIPVTLTVQVDSVAKPGMNDRVIPGNVLQAMNFYQTHGIIHGRTTIVAADPTRTTILGNVRRDYKEEPAACHAFSWYARLFTKSHIEIECDPDVWSTVKALLQKNLPPPSISLAAK